MHSASNMNDLSSSYFSLLNINNSNRLAASISNASTNSNNINSNNFDFKSNGVILDVNKNNQQIFINGIKLATYLPTITEASKRIFDSTEHSVETHAKITIPDSVSLIISKRESATLVKIKPKKVFHFKRDLIKENDLNGLENPNELANNLIIINNKQQSFESIENTKDMTNNKLPKLEKSNGVSTNSTVLKQSSLASNTFKNVNNNLLFQSDLKPISFKLPATEANDYCNNESFFENTSRMSKILKKPVADKRHDKLKTNTNQISNSIAIDDDFNPLSSLNYSTQYTQRGDQKNTLEPQTFTLKSKNISTTTQKEDKDKRFRKKLTPITEAVKQQKPKKFSVELTNKVVEEKTNHFYENNPNAFQMQYTESYSSWQSNNVSVPLPVSQIMIRSKPKTPRSSLNDKHELKAPAHGRWSPIKITPMRSQKLFEKLKIEDYETEKLKNLTDIFKQLDTDDDGHLDFQTIESNFFQDLKPAQRSFIFQLYQILSETTFFGLKEFFSLSLIIERIKKVEFKRAENYWDHFKSTDFEDYKDDIKDFIKLIDNHDLKGSIRIGDVIQSRNKNFDSEKFFKNSRNQINNIMMKLRFLIDGDDLPTKLSNYVLLIPLYIYLECLI